MTPRREGTAEQRHRARSARDRRRHWTPVLRMVLVSVLVLAVSAASLAAIASWQLTTTLTERSVSIANGGSQPQPIGAIHGGFTVLLVGEDNAAGQRGWGAARQATMNDVDIVVHVAADHRSGVVLSIPRDLVIAQPRCTDPVTKQVAPAVAAEPVNTAFERGGLGCVVASVSALTGLTIPYAALFSFAGTVAMADAVGGVPVCVSHAIHDPDSGLTLPAGRSVVSGRTALAYLRDRHGVGDGSDLARISSQQAYMSALMRKMTSSSTLTSPARLYTLAETAAHAITLSTSLADLRTMTSMLLAVRSIPTSRLTFVQYPTQPDPANLDKVVPNRFLAVELMRRVHEDRPVRLSASTRGYSTTAKGHAPSGGSHDGAPAGAHATSIAGLSGQTAAQQTCSVAAPG